MNGNEFLPKSMEFLDMAILEYAIFPIRSAPRLEKSLVVSINGKEIGSAIHDI